MRQFSLQYLQKLTAMPRLFKVLNIAGSRRNILARNVRHAARIFAHARQAPDPPVRVLERKLVSLPSKTQLGFKTVIVKDCTDVSVIGILSRAMAMVGITADYDEVAMFERWQECEQTAVLREGLRLRLKYDGYEFIGTAMDMHTRRAWLKLLRL